MMCAWKKFAVVSMAVLAMGTGAVWAQEPSDSLKDGFVNPPSGARPRVWWHWMNGNISQPGIKLDLEWMHRVGIAGFQNFDAALQTPQVVDHRLAYMTPEWKDAFKYATTLADQLGMEEAIAGSPGWSESGGPWVSGPEGMKKYVWSEAIVEGGKPFSGVLPHPPSNTGAFQNETVHDQQPPPGAAPIPQFYSDVAVIAYKRPESDVTIEALHAKITASGGSPDLAMLSDGDLEKTTGVPIPAVGQASWIQYEFPEPQSIRAVTYVTKDPDWMEGLIAGIAAPHKTLQASDDGQIFRLVAELQGDAPENTLSFASVTAKYFRVTFERTPPPQVPFWAQGIDLESMRSKAPAPPTTYDIAELVLHPGARVNHFEEKAAFVADGDMYGLATPPLDPAKSPTSVDLTSKMRADGTLDWTPPAGDWVVLRFGYSLLGITNHPATAEATGLEVDKLNGALREEVHGRLPGQLQETVGAEYMGKRGIRYVITIVGRRVRRTGPTTCSPSSRSGAAMIRCPGCRFSPGRWWRARRRATSSCGTSARPLPT
jgi:hypothetical protein